MVLQTYLRYPVFLFGSRRAVSFLFVFWIVQFVYNKKTKAYPSLFVKKYFIGKKEKFSYKTEFVCEDADGNVTNLGKAMRACKIAYYPYLADIFCGRLSFIGPVPMRAADSLAVKGEARVRFAVRAGLLSSLEKYGGEALTYADMFEEDAEYVSSRSLFKDFSYFFLYLIAEDPRRQEEQVGRMRPKKLTCGLCRMRERSPRKRRRISKNGARKNCAKRCPSAKRRRNIRDDRKRKPRKRGFRFFVFFGNLDNLNKKAYNNCKQNEGRIICAEIILICSAKNSRPRRRKGGKRTENGED